MQHGGGASSCSLLVNGWKMSGLDGKTNVYFAESSNNGVL